MRRLIPYAGYDPGEEDFSGLEIERGGLLGNRSDFGPRKVMNVQLAIQLRASGMKWDDIGRELAAQEGRPVPYRGDSVIQSIVKGR
jgi:hypothetical protein